ncbi:MAG: hypothetical protein ACR2IP_06510 [Solirubrobacteraceae bacterium]
MLQRHRAPGLDSRPAHTLGIESRPAHTKKHFAHLRSEWVDVLRWLHFNRVDFVLVGAVAAAVRGDTGAGGPVTIVPAPYGRNLERLAVALSCADTRLRIGGWGAGEIAAPETIPIKVSAEKLGDGTRWPLRCGVHDLDVEGQVAGGQYQELLYEAARFELEPGIFVEVASPQDQARYARLRETGAAAEPEIRVTRSPPRLREPEIRATGNPPAQQEPEIRIMRVPPA